MEKHFANSETSSRPIDVFELQEICRFTFFRLQKCEMFCLEGRSMNSLLPRIWLICWSGMFLCQGWRCTSKIDLLSYELSAFHLLNGAFVSFFSKHRYFIAWLLSPFGDCVNLFHCSSAAFPRHWQISTSQTKIPRNLLLHAEQTRNIKEQKQQKRGIADLAKGGLSQCSFFRDVEMTA